MSETNRRLEFGSALEETTVRRIVRVGVGLVGLLVMLGLAVVLPAVDRLLAALFVSPTAVVLAIATLLIVGALLRIAPAVERAVEQALEGPPEPVANAASGAKLLVGFTAVVIAYNGFAAAVTPLFEAFGIGGIYHLGFLALGLLVLGAFARRLYRCWAPATDLLTAYALGALGALGGGARSDVPIDSYRSR